MLNEMIKLIFLLKLSLTNMYHTQKKIQLNQDW